MSFGVQIDIPILALQDYLNGMTTRISDFSVPLSKGADLLYADIMSAFSTGGASIGESWDPLAQSTMERMKYARGKSGPGFGQGPTGNLLGSIQKFVRPFVMGVEAPVPHAHLFESGHHGLATPGHGIGGASAAPAAGSWRDFVKTNMGAYMKSEGSHGAAMVRLGREWRANKQGGAEIKKRHNPIEGNIGAGVEPPREFMKITEETEQAIIDLIMDYAVEEQAA